jgi:hypothetical protein
MICFGCIRRFEKSFDRARGCHGVTRPDQGADRQEPAYRGGKYEHFSTLICRREASRWPKLKARYGVFEADAESKVLDLKGRLPPICLERVKNASDRKNSA